jgi:hypothetical protein
MTDLIPDVPLDAAPPALVTEDDTAVEPSILNDLRVRRAKAGAGAEPLYLDVPNYDGKLVLEFKWVPLKKLARTGVQLAKIKEATTQTIAAAADTVVATCSELLVRLEGETETRPLSTNGVPVTFGDPRVAYALGFPKAADARTTVVSAFNNEYALIDVANKVTAWLENTTLTGDEAFLGE